MNRIWLVAAVLCATPAIVWATRTAAPVVDLVVTPAKVLELLCCAEHEDANAAKFKKDKEVPGVGKELKPNVVISDSANIKACPGGNPSAYAYVNQDGAVLLVINADHFGPLHELRKKAIMRHEVRHAGQNLNFIPNDAPEGTDQLWIEMNKAYGELDAHIADIAYINDLLGPPPHLPDEENAKDDQTWESTINIAKNAKKLADMIQNIELGLGAGGVAALGDGSQTKKRLKVLKMCVLIAWNKHIKPWNDTWADEGFKVVQPTKLLQGEDTTAALITQFENDTKNCKKPPLGG